MNPMSICLLNDSFPPRIDGVANAVVNYASVISRSYGSACVLTPHYPDLRTDYPFPVLEYPSLDTSQLVGYRAGLPVSARVLEQLEEQKPDILHSHCPIASTYAARIVRNVHPMPLILTYHTKFDIDIQNALRLKILQESAVKLLVENIRACDEVWVVSKGAGDNLRSLGYEGETIVMSNGVDLPRGRVSGAEIEKVCGDYDLGRGVPVFLFVGRIMWYKGLRLLLDALRELRTQGCQFRMVFVGNGGDFDAVKACSSELGLEDVCIFTGPVYDREALRAWYCRADLFLFPSTFDTNGLVVREAASCALGSVLVRGSCAAEDTVDGVNCYQIEENAASLAELLLRLCRHPDEMRTVGENAQKELYLSWEDAVNRAWMRYGVVRENFEKGEYPRHRDATELLLQNYAELVETQNRVRQTRSELGNRLHRRLSELEQLFDRFL